MDDVLTMGFSRKNIEYAMKRSWDKIAKEYLNVYREALAK
jgi:glycosyltransferase involved in cell wall biosynthesis